MDAYFQSYHQLLIIQSYFADLAKASFSFWDSFGGSILANVGKILNISKKNEMF